MTTQAQELARLGLYVGYALEAKFSERQMQVFREARSCGECAAVAFDRAKKAGSAQGRAVAR